MVRINYLERIKKGVILFDGAMGTMLYEEGVPLNSCFEEVSLSNPALVASIHRRYIEAGAQVIETNSFGANPIKLKTYQIENKAEEINRAAAKIARKEAGSDVYVAGSVGPIGQRLAPLGPISIKEAEEAFKIQISALVGEDIDFIIFESFKDIKELLLAVKVAKSLAPQMAVQAQFTIGPLNVEEYKNEAPSIAKQLDAENAIDIVGVNCTVGPDHMLEILMAIKPFVKKPISVMPNAGLPREIDNRNMYLASPAYFGNYALKYLEAGATAIGGCCGTTPNHIKEAGKMILSLGAVSEIKVTSVTEKAVQEKEEVLLGERSSLGKALADGAWITTVELVPPMGTDLSKIIERSAELKSKGISYINLPDGPRASSRISVGITALEIEKKAGVEAIPHICCRDKNLIGIQSELLGFQAVGLKNIFLITGDPPKVGNYPDVTGVFDVDAIGLITLAKRLNKGIDFGGKELSGQTSFVIGAGANPATTGLEREIERCFLKAEAGADYFITQPVFDYEHLLAFIDKIKDTKIPVIAGIWPLASYRNALFLNNEVPGVTIPDYIMKRMEKTQTKEEGVREGILIAREILAAVKSAVKGIQISPPFGVIQSAIDVIREDFE
ncbi:MAG: bifunctional homocysteine S-methyltransferase/methylenetetrahydrofolate reductase [Spirochaetaceae bacterium]|nr:bifunctional homocysteine S-methyltransferase/methylenetetrahydrofolate reductase [Spirochaetaceae bacterium]